MIESYSQTEAFVELTKRLISTKLPHEYSTIHSSKTLTKWRTINLVVQLNLSGKKFPAHRSLEKFFKRLFGSQNCRADALSASVRPNVSLVWECSLAYFSRTRKKFLRWKTSKETSSAYIRTACGKRSTEFGRRLLRSTLWTPQLNGLVQCVDCFAYCMLFNRRVSMCESMEESLWKRSTVIECAAHWMAILTHPDCDWWTFDCIWLYLTQTHHHTHCH